MRCISNVLAVLLVVAITIATTTIAYRVVSDYIRSRQPRGEVIDAYIVVSASPGRAESVKVSVFISCSGPNCDNYEVREIKLTGYDRISGDKYDLSTFLIADPPRLKQGITRIDVIGYYPRGRRVNELSVRIHICSSPARCRVITKSATIG